MYILAARGAVNCTLGGKPEGHLSTLISLYWNSMFAEQAQETKLLLSPPKV